MQNKLDAVTSGMEEAEGRRSETEYKIMENDEGEKKRDKKILDHEGRIRDLSDSMTHNNVRIIRVPEEEREKGAKGVLKEITAENFPNLGKETDSEIQETQRTPFRHNLNQSSTQHIIVKLAKYKDKERILKAARDKQVLTYKGRHIRVAADIST